MLFTVKEVLILRETLQGTEAYQYCEESVKDGQNEARFWKALELGYQHDLGAVLFCEPISKNDHPENEILTGPGASSQASRHTIQFPYYLDTLPQQSFGNFLEFQGSPFDEKDVPKAEESRTRRNSIVNFL